jgi:signal transduction histidine kinase
MVRPAIPSSERSRLNDLVEYGILDTAAETDFDDITKLASAICRTPISLVSLVDDRRQWFKSHHGLDVPETPKDFSFCAHAINTPSEIFIVPDATKDERFFDNPLVTDDPQVIFYAGVPLVSPKGNALGTLCVIDHNPKVLTPDQLTALKSLSNQVIAQLELRRKNEQLQSMYARLQSGYKDMEQFAYVAAHDLKSPLNNILGLINIIRDETADSLDPDSAEYFDHIEESAGNMSHLIDGILEYSKATHFDNLDKQQVRADHLFREIRTLVQVPDGMDLCLTSDVEILTVPRTLIIQLFLNLINNALKYCDNESGRVDVSIADVPGKYIFTIADNGKGIPQEGLDTMFDLFKSVKYHKNSGTGIGLAIVKKLVEMLDGTIEVESKSGIGTTFRITARK